ncbi:MAG: type II toxin-antitoxin system prevent-host-death family antitoxin [Chthoniobacterales bacterium]
MRSVSVASLKSNLSAHLEAVRGGQEILVTSHRHPIARVVPLERNENGGLGILPANKPVSSLKGVRGVKLNFDPVATLLADRRRR